MRTLRRDRRAFRPLVDGLSKRIAPACVLAPLGTTPTVCAPLGPTMTSVTAPNTTGFPIISTDPATQSAIVAIIKR